MPRLSVGRLPRLGKTNPERLPCNLTGDRYHTDGYRGAAILEREGTVPRFLDWGEDTEAQQQ